MKTVLTAICLILFATFCFAETFLSYFAGRTKVTAPAASDRLLFEYSSATKAVKKIRYGDMRLAMYSSPTLTDLVTIPTPFTLGAVSMTATGTELNYVAGVTSAIQTQLDAKLPTSTFTTYTTGRAGYYTPTALSFTNVTSSTPGKTFYSRNGSVVSFTGFVSVTPTTGGLLTTLILSLPVASNFTGAADGMGQFYLYDAAAQPMQTLSVDATYDGIKLAFTPDDAISYSYRFFGMYEIK